MYWLPSSKPQSGSDQSTLHTLTNHFHILGEHLGRITATVMHLETALSRLTPHFNTLGALMPSFHAQIAAQALFGGSGKQAGSFGAHDFVMRNRQPLADAAKEATKGSAATSPEAAAQKAFMNKLFWKMGEKAVTEEVVKASDEGDIVALTKAANDLANEAKEAFSKLKDAIDGKNPATSEQKQDFGKAGDKGTTGDSTLPSPEPYKDDPETRNKRNSDRNALHKKLVSEGMDSAKAREQVNKDLPYIPPPHMKAAFDANKEKAKLWKTDPAKAKAVEDPFWAQVRQSTGGGQNAKLPFAAGSPFLDMGLGADTKKKAIPPAAKQSSSSWWKDLNPFSSGDINAGQKAFTPKFNVPRQPGMFDWLKDLNPFSSGDINAGQKNLLFEKLGPKLKATPGGVAYNPDQKGGVSAVFTGEHPNRSNNAETTLGIKKRSPVGAHDMEGLVGGFSKLAMVLPLAADGLRAVSDLFAGLVKSAAPDALDTLQTSMTLLAGTLGRDLIPATLQASKALQDLAAIRRNLGYSDTDNKPPSKTRDVMGLVGDMFSIAGPGSGMAGGMNPLGFYNLLTRSRPTFGQMMGDRGPMLRADAFKAAPGYSDIGEAYKKIQIGALSEDEITVRLHQDQAKALDAMVNAAKQTNGSLLNILTWVSGGQN